MPVPRTFSALLSLCLTALACVSLPARGEAALAAPAPESVASTPGGSGLHLRAAPLEEIDEIHGAAPRILTLDLTHDANDIWDRMRRGFSMPDLDSDLVTKAQIFYLSKPGFLKQVLERGRRYMYYFLSQIEERGLPTELALLPMVESSYNPMAYSRSHASGLWQFIPSTGRNFNLTQNHWVDERRDVIASTTAALDYLQNIYEMQGDWHLALASYNWGEGAVARAIQKNQAAGLPTSYLDLQMPEETRNYVPKLQALKNIIARPELFKINLPYVPNRPYFVQVGTPPGVDLATAAKLADMPLEEFMALNPGFNRPVIASDDHQLVIPVDKEDTFRANLAELGSGPQWRTYQMQGGDRVNEVAERFGLSTSQLLRINGLSSHQQVHPGQSLLVPAGGDVNAAMAAARLLPVVASAAPKTQASAKSRGSRNGRHSASRGRASGRAGKAPSAHVASKSKPAARSAASSRTTKPKTTKKKK